MVDVKTWVELILSGGAMACMVVCRPIFISKPTGIKLIWELSEDHYGLSFLIVQPNIQLFDWYLQI